MSFKDWSQSQDKNSKNKSQGDSKAAPADEKAVPIVDKVPAEAAPAPKST